MEGSSGTMTRESTLTMKALMERRRSIRRSAASTEGAGESATNWSLASGENAKAKVDNAHPGQKDRIILVEVDALLT